MRGSLRHCDFVTEWQSDFQKIHSALHSWFMGCVDTVNYRTNWYVKWIRMSGEECDEDLFQAVPVFSYKEWRKPHVLVTAVGAPACVSREYEYASDALQPWQFIWLFDINC
jgi:hypothetical protein